MFHAIEIDHSQHWISPPDDRVFQQRHQGHRAGEAHCDRPTEGSPGGRRHDPCKRDDHHDRRRHALLAGATGGRGSVRETRDNLYHRSGGREAEQVAAQEEQRKGAGRRGVQPQGGPVHVYGLRDRWFRQNLVYLVRLNEIMKEHSPNCPFISLMFKSISTL